MTPLRAGSSAGGVLSVVLVRVWTGCGSYTGRSGWGGKRIYARWFKGRGGVTLCSTFSPSPAFCFPSFRFPAYRAM